MDPINICEAVKALPLSVPSCLTFWSFYLFSSVSELDLTPLASLYISLECWFCLIYFIIFFRTLFFFYSINEREWYCLYLSFALLRYLWFRFELICDWLRFCRVCLNHRHRSCGLVLIPATLVISDNSIIHIMDLSSLNNVECMEAILREYARHRYVLNSTRAESIAAVLSQLPASGPYSRDNVNLMFMVVGAEYSNDGHFLSRLRRILPDLASNWDDAGEMGWVSLVRAFGWLFVFHD